PLSGGELVLGIRQRVTQLLLCAGQQRFDVLEFHTAQCKLAHETFLDVGFWLETRQKLLLWCMCFRPGVLWFCIHSSRTILTHNDPLSLSFSPRCTRPTRIEHANRGHTPGQQQFHPGRASEEQ